MSIENFIGKFAQAIEVDPGNIKADTEYKKLDIWDSLNTLSVIAMADADFNVALTGKDIESGRTVGDLWNLVETRSKS